VAYLKIGSNNKEFVYISKDVILKGSELHGSRINNIILNDTYAYVIAAKITYRHIDLKKERDIKYEKKKNKELDNAFKLIKKKGIFCSTKISFEYRKCLNHLIKNDRINNVRYILENNDIKDINKLFKYNDSRYISVNSFILAKENKEMLDLINSYKIDTKEYKRRIRIKSIDDLLLSSD